MQTNNKAGAISAMFLLLLAVAGTRAAEIPRTIAFQGVLKDAIGKAITTPTSVTFTLYDAETAGTPVWAETKDITPGQSGIFTTSLGTGTPFNSITFDRAYWVGIKPGSDAEMTPRLPLMSVPYALGVSNNRVYIQGDAIWLSLAPQGGGQLKIASNPNDNQLFLEGFSADGLGSPDVMWITGYSGQWLPRLNIRSTLTVVSGELSVTDGLAVGGNASCNTLTLTSSRRFKEDIQPIKNALGTVSKLQGIRYNWDAEHGGKRDFGFVAEDVAKVVPELVTMEPDGVNAKGMDYSHLTALTVEAIKQLKADNDILRAQNRALAARLDRLEQKEDK